MRYRTVLLLLSVCALAALAAGVLAQRPAPARATGAVAISSGGGTHTCVLNQEGGVRCWGSNPSGQVGDGTESTRRQIPTQVVGLETGVAALSVGGSHSCALMVSGGVKCWGSNFYGQIGDGTNGGTPLDPLARTTPVDVCAVYDETVEQCLELLTGVAAIGAGGLHTCAVMETGGLKCWGRNEYGQVGDGTRGDENPDTLDSNIRPTPVAVCAAYDDLAGQCVEPLSGIVAVEGGGNYTCAVTEAGTAKCWGVNSSGQLGDGAGGGTFTAPVVLPSPVDVCATYDQDAGACIELLTGVAAVTAASSHTCALVQAPTSRADDRGIKCWGGSFDGQLGDGNQCGADEIFFRCLAPTDVIGLESDAAVVVAGSGHTCALTTAGAAKCWGDNLNPGQVGDGRRCGLECPIPTDVCADAVCAVPLTGVAGLAAGFFHNCALLQTGAAKCWGGNFWGELGSASCCNDTTTPVDVVALGVKRTPTPTVTPTFTLTPADTMTPTVSLTPGPAGTPVRATTPTAVVAAAPVALPATGGGPGTGRGARVWIATAFASAGALLAAHGVVRLRRARWR